MLLGQLSWKICSCVHCNITQCWKSPERKRGVYTSECFLLLKGWASCYIYFCLLTCVELSCTVHLLTCLLASQHKARRKRHWLLRSGQTCVRNIRTLKSQALGSACWGSWHLSQTNNLSTRVLCCLHSHACVIWHHPSVLHRASNMLNHKACVNACQSLHVSQPLATENRGSKHDAKWHRVSSLFLTAFLPVSQIHTWLCNFCWMQCRTTEACACCWLTMWQPSTGSTETAKADKLASTSTMRKPPNMYDIAVWGFLHASRHLPRPAYTNV